KGAAGREVVRAAVAPGEVRIGAAGGGVGVEPLETGRRVEREVVSVGGRGEQRVVQADEDRASAVRRQEQRGQPCPDDGLLACPGSGEHGLTLPPAPGGAENGRARRDSTPQPPDPKSGALSIELRARSDDYRNSWTCRCRSRCARSPTRSTRDSR